MKVSFEGKIICRNNGDTDAARISYAYTQMVDNKMVIYFHGSTQDYSSVTKFMVIAKDGTIEYISNDLGFGE